MICVLILWDVYVFIKRQYISTALPSCCCWQVRLYDPRFRALSKGTLLPVSPKVLPPRTIIIRRSMVKAPEINMFWNELWTPYLQHQLQAGLQDRLSNDSSSSSDGFSAVAHPHDMVWLKQLHQLPPNGHDCDNQAYACVEVVNRFATSAAGQDVTLNRNLIQLLYCGGVPQEVFEG